MAEPLPTLAEQPISVRFHPANILLVHRRKITSQKLAWRLHAIENYSGEVP
ncbi:MAG: hypothetical protein Q7T46_12400 [Polaromonas sp.]|nr:hypothetical protein [Polaromonas sp.]